MRSSQLFIVLFLVNQLALPSFANENSIDDQWVTADSVVAFQPYSETQTTQFDDARQKPVEVSWVNLNSHVDGWFLMDVVYEGEWGRAQTLSFNIENNFPRVQSVDLLSNGNLQISSKKSGEIILECNILGTTVDDGTAAQAVDGDPYMRLCEGLLSLRNHKNGHKGWTAWGSTLLRNIGGDWGDSLVNLVKKNLYEGDFYESGEDLEGAAIGESVGGPADARVLSDSGFIGDHNLMIEAEENLSEGMAVGRWYKTKNYEGAYISVMKPKNVASDILDTFTDRVNPIDHGGAGNQSRAVGEGNALVVSVAIDLKKYSLSWHNGTEHPGVGWSSRAKVAHHDSQGPDGFGNLEPLDFPGVVNPVNIPDVIGTFAGGFQRRHSAFKWGPYTSYNRGHHYGFMENGVLMSTIVPNLATLIVYNTGEVEMKTWQPSDAENMHLMKDIRQNGVPLIDQNEPHPFVKEWGAGNWSGSGEAMLKTPRTSACIYEEDDKKYLIVSYFSTHTPSAMARVLQSYGCRYAIHLDMNHPKFAYAALFQQREDGSFNIEHLHQSMSGEDVKVNDMEAPRSILTPTYKDFFTIFKR